MSIIINDPCDRLSQAYSTYIPDQAIVKELSPLLHDKTITVVFGTWCEDSQIHVPPFYKILDVAGFSGDATTLIEVDKEKKAVNRHIDHLNIKNVPTFIIFERGKEVGRIVEQPLVTLEQDLLHLLLNTNKQYDDNTGKKLA